MFCFTPQAFIFIQNMSDGFMSAPKIFRKYTLKFTLGNNLFRHGITQKRQSYLPSLARVFVSPTSWVYRASGPYIIYIYHFPFMNITDFVGVYTIISLAIVMSFRFKRCANGERIMLATKDQRMKCVAIE